MVILSFAVIVPYPTKGAYYLIELATKFTMA